MRLLAVPLLLAMPLPVLAQADQAEAIEDALVQCIFEKEPELLYAMRDAEGPEGFSAAFRRGVEICEFPERQYSMARFFDAVNARIGKPNYEDDK